MEVLNILNSKKDKLIKKNKETILIKLIFSCNLPLSKILTIQRKRDTKNRQNSVKAHKALKIILKIQHFVIHCCLANPSGYPLTVLFCSYRGVAMTKLDMGKRENSPQLSKLYWRQ